jgi:carbon storage regulator CsrA
MALHSERKVGQRIFIGENIIITLKSINRNRATISVDAPKSILILREEVGPTEMFL